MFPLGIWKPEVRRLAEGWIKAQLKKERLNWDLLYRRKEFQRISRESPFLPNQVEWHCTDGRDMGEHAGLRATQSVNGNLGIGGHQGANAPWFVVERPLNKIFFMSVKVSIMKHWCQQALQASQVHFAMPGRVYIRVYS